MPSKGLIAVTGGTGFVGRHVISALLEAGYEVRALARNPVKLADMAHDNLEIFKGGLGSSDAAFVDGSEVVVHMAGLIKARTLYDFLSINEKAAGEMAKVAQSADVKRFVLLSSQTAGRPGLSNYGTSKLAGELAVKAAYKGHIAIVRAPAVIGPGDKATKPFFSFIKKGKLPCAGGKNWRDRKMAIVFVKDLARDIVTRAAIGDYDGKTVTPCTVPNLTWPKFAKACSDAMGHPVKTTPIPLTVIYPIAAITSLASRLFGIGHLTLGKLREFLYEDWQSEDVIQNATPFTEALRITAASYETE